MSDTETATGDGSDTASTSDTSSSGGGDLTDEQHSWASQFCNVDTRASPDDSSGGGLLGSLADAASSLASSAVQTADGAVGAVVDTAVSLVGDAGSALGAAAVAAAGAVGAAAGGTPVGAAANALGLKIDPPHLQWTMPQSDIDICNKYLDDHKFAAILRTDGSPPPLGFNAGDYTPSIDGVPVGFFGLTETLIGLTMAGNLPSGPIRDQEWEQISQIVQNRYDPLVAQAVKDRSAAKQVTTQITGPPDQTQTISHDDAVRVWGLDAVANYNKAWDGGKPPAPLQAGVNLTFPTITIDLGNKGSWDFSILNQPQFGLAVDKGGVSGQAAINLFQAVWKDKYGPRLEADLQATLTNLKLDENPQFGGMAQLEFKLNQTWGLTAFLATQSDQKQNSKDFETNFSGGFGLVVHILKGPK
jgi:hypothetical protein